ncbi:MAG: HAMP domain-containing histidine kinase [Anaerolineales bacterium]|nr:HAMP domain-containing histidine kinase [Anaerolineales bacterium]MCX7608351.1 HAMP domain-containing histidine kinase [Anaerolineales bacterium]MDW8226416.1 HAMP domain-containing sensor histidine kinase [Anaerolineales bacterium]
MSDTQVELQDLFALALQKRPTDSHLSLDDFFRSLRAHFIFDNLAIYKPEADNQNLEVYYALAAGRGRSKEADVSWGEDVACQVTGTCSILVEHCETSAPPYERTKRPCRLGLPLVLNDGIGALIFVRFGGPPYTREDFLYALLACYQVAYVIEHQALGEARKQLKLAAQRAQLQDDFIATISHELNTPLGFIKGYATSLLRPDANWDEATRREFLTIIDEESDHLLRLIERLLDSARLQNKILPMNFQPVRLDSLLRDIVQRYQAHYPQLQVNLETHPTSPIQADSTRLTQVFSNLFDNALKYAPGSPIHIVLRQERERQSVTFSDQGPGMKPQDLPFLFERFYRTDGPRSTRGTGLGLFICKQIIEAHHGEISVHTAPGKGTSFTIVLPVKQPLQEK